MAQQLQNGRRTAAAIVARIARDRAAEQIADRFGSQLIAFGHLGQESRADVIRGIQRSLERWWRFLSNGAMPPASDFEPLRDWTRSRANEGVRLEDLLQAFGLAHRMGWELLRANARPDESDALLELVDLLAQYLDRVTAVVTETYMAEREVLVSEEERRTGRLLDRLCVDTPLATADRELADRLGVVLDRPYSPFAIVVPGRPAHVHAALAARLRRDGWRLTVTQGELVFGLTWKSLDLHDLGEGRDALLAIGEPVPRSELAAAREELTVLAEHARQIGLRGRLLAADYPLEILLGRLPSLAARVRDRVLAPLAGEAHGELTRTLEAFVACRFDRAASSAALKVHRNTLAYRLGRIEQITGLDLGSPRDLAYLYIAIGSCG